MLIIGVVTTVAAESASYLLKATGHKGRKLAWETVRLRSALDTASTYYNSESKCQKLCNPTQCDECLWRIFPFCTPCWIWLMTTLGLRTWGKFLWLSNGPSTVFDPNHFAAEAKRHCKELVITEHNMKLIACIMMYADIVFHHERPAHQLFSFKDYEPDVVSGRFYGKDWHTCKGLYRAVFNEWV